VTAAQDAVALAKDLADLAARTQAAVDAARALAAQLADPGPGPTPTPGLVPAGTAAVRIGSATFPVAGINPTGTEFPGGRGPNQLVVYQAPVGFTVTNMYGVEVTVFGGTVLAVVDRQATAQASGLIVPAGGYVLSGHGTARDWLLAHAVKGATVEPLTTLPDPGPTPGPDPTPVTGRPGMLWDYGLQPVDPSAVPADILAKIGHVSAFVAQSARSGTGNLRDVWGYDKARVSAWRAAGVKVDLCIGGAKDGGITVTTTAQADELVASVRAQVKACGYTGVDLDLEPSGGKWTQGAILQACEAFIADGLEVHVTSALYGQWTAAWGAVVKALGAGLTSWRVMLYDFPEAADSRLTAVTLDKLDTMRGYVAREDQLVACYATGAAMVASPGPVVAASYAAARKAHPSVGWGVWHGGVDKARGWQSARALIG
jgi:hypothetical protein